MFCFKCGKELSEEMMFCPFCGTKMTVSNDNESEKGFNEDDLLEKDYDDDEENEEDERLELAREYFKKSNEIFFEIKDNVTAKNLVRYLVYLDKAAELGLTEAIIIRGHVAEGISKDYKKAEECYKKAMDAGSYDAHSKLIELYYDHNEALKIDLGLVYSMSVDWINESYDNSEEHKIALLTYCKLFREPYVDSDITCFEELAKIDNKRYFDLGVELYNKYCFINDIKCKIPEKTAHQANDNLKKAQICMKLACNANSYRAKAGLLMLKEANGEKIEDEDYCSTGDAVNYYLNVDNKNNVTFSIKLSLFYYGIFNIYKKEDDFFKDKKNKGNGLELLSEFVLTYDDPDLRGYMRVTSDKCLLKACKVLHEKLSDDFFIIFCWNESLKEKYKDSFHLADLIEEKMNKLIPDLSYECRLSILESLLIGNWNEGIKRNRDVFKATLKDVFCEECIGIYDEDPPTSYDKIDDNIPPKMMLSYQRILEVYELYIKYPDEFDDEEKKLVYNLFENFEQFDEDYKNDNKEYVELLQNKTTSETSEENVSNSTNEQKLKTDTCDKPKTDDRIEYILQKLGKCAYTYKEDDTNYLFKGTYFWHNAEIDSRIRASLLIPSSDNIYMMINLDGLFADPFSNGLALTGSGIYFRTKKSYGSIKWDEFKVSDYERTMSGIKIRGVKIYNMFQNASDGELNLLMITLGLILKKIDIKEIDKQVKRLDLNQ
ncbi:MAG: zinc-ribbon domain-containing protein [Acutalibacteraceae bacterium]